jgi:hypothetical protein
MFPQALPKWWRQPPAELDAEAGLLLPFAEEWLRQRVMSAKTNVLADRWGLPAAAASAQQCRPAWMGSRKWQPEQVIPQAVPWWWRLPPAEGGAEAGLLLPFAVDWKKWPFAEE